MEISKLMDALGVDYESTMPRFVGDESFYQSILHSFFEKNAFEGLNDAILASDYKSAFEISHNAKGVCLNLGISKLEAYVVPLTEALRNPPYQADEIERLARDTINCYETLKKYVS